MAQAVKIVAQHKIFWNQAAHLHERRLQKFCHRRMGPVFEHQFLQVLVGFGKAPENRRGSRDHLLAVGKNPGLDGFGMLHKLFGASPGPLEEIFLHPLEQGSFHLTDAAQQGRLFFEFAPERQIFPEQLEPVREMDAVEGGHPGGMMGSGLTGVGKNPQMNRFPFSLQRRIGAAGHAVFAGKFNVFGQTPEVPAGEVFFFPLPSAALQRRAADLFGQLLPQFSDVAAAADFAAVIVNDAEADL